jgi:hypothetical protein
MTSIRITGAMVLAIALAGPAFAFDYYPQRKLNTTTIHKPSAAIMT